MPEATIQPARRARRFQCRHIFTDGRRCGSPCLRNEEFCFYHHTTRGAVEQAQEGRDRFNTFQLPRLEDHASVLVAIEEVLQRLAACAIDTRRAGLLLYGLQTASIALSRTASPQRAPEPVEEIIHHPRLGTLAPRAIVAAPGEEQPALTPEEEEDLTAEGAAVAAAAPEPPPAKPTGIAAMSQQEIAQLYEDHISQISRRTPREAPQPAILASLTAAAEIASPATPNSTPTLSSRPERSSPPLSSRPEPQSGGAERPAVPPPLHPPCTPVISTEATPVISTGAAERRSGETRFSTTMAGRSLRGHLAMLSTRFSSKAHTRALLLS